MILIKKIFSKNNNCLYNSMLGNLEININFSRVLMKMIILRDMMKIIKIKKIFNKNSSVFNVRSEDLT